MKAKNNSNELKKKKKKKKEKKRCHSIYELLKSVPLMQIVDQVDVVFVWHLRTTFNSLEFLLFFKASFCLRLWHLLGFVVVFTSTRLTPLSRWDKDILYIFKQ